MATRPPGIIARILSRRSGDPAATPPQLPALSPPALPAAVERLTAPAVSLVQRFREAWENVRIDPFTTIGRRAGWVDSNSQLDPSDVYGVTPWALGVYGKIRHSHPVASTALDAKRAYIAGLDYSVVPRSANPDIEQRLAAAAVGWMLTHMPHQSLAQWVAEVEDAMFAYGHSLHELVLTQDGMISMPRIPSHAIWQWDVDFANAAQLNGVLVKGNLGQIDPLPSWKLATYSYADCPGNWWGISKLRRLVAITAAYEQDMRLYLEQQRMSRGILYLQENGKGTSEPSALAGQRWLRELYLGSDSPLYLDEGVDLKAITSQSPHSGGIADILSYYDKLYREVLLAGLGNVGIDGNGARSLGETVAVRDQQKLSAHVEDVLDHINGNRTAYGSALRWVTAILGFDPDHCTPMIVAEDNSVDAAPARRTGVRDLITSGVITPADLSPESRVQLIEELGLKPSAELAAQAKQADEPIVASTPDVATEEPQTAFAAPADVAQAAAQALEVRSGLSADQRMQAATLIARARALAHQQPIPIATLRRIAAWRIAHTSYVNAPEGSAEWQEYHANGGPTAGAWLSSVLGGMIP